MAIAECSKFGQRATEAEFLELPDDGFLYELEDGILTGKPAVALWEANVAVNAIGLLGPFARGKGIMTCGKGGFRLRDGTIRVPSLSFTRKERFPGGKAPNEFGDLAPDLCVEIISPSECPEQTRRKVQEYFDGGTVQVWHVLPERQEVVVFTSPTDTQTLSAESILDAGGILPGFSCRVSYLFTDDWM